MKNRVELPELNPFVVISTHEYDLPVIEIASKYINTRKHVVNNNSTVDEGYNNYITEKQKKTVICTDNQTLLINKVIGENSILTDKGRSLLMYIMFRLVKDKDTIVLDSINILSNLGWKDRQKVADAKKELQYAGIISLKSKSEYWINPYYLFCGSRIGYYQNGYQEHIKIVSRIKQE